jgi:hypothetical protein
MFTNNEGDRKKRDEFGERKAGAINSGSNAPFYDTSPASPSTYQPNSFSSCEFPFCQPVAAAEGANDVLNFCQPVGAEARVVLEREDVGKFIDLARRAQNEAAGQRTIDLRSWVDSEALEIDQMVGLTRKLTVAFAIGKLLQHLQASVSSYSQDELLRLCSVDNFAVLLAPDGTCDEGREVIGIDMITPPMSLQVSKKSCDIFSSLKPLVVDAIVARHSPFCCAKKAIHDKGEGDTSLCYELGLLVNFIFFNGSSLYSWDGSSLSALPENPQETQSNLNPMYDVLRALSISPSRITTESSGQPSQSAPLGTMKYKVRLACQQVNNTFQQDCTPISLGAAVDDLHSLLRWPDHFLFGANQEIRGITTMYGRSNETSALVDAFNRVASSGNSEAFFVKGFSGRVMSLPL